MQSAVPAETLDWGEHWRIVEVEKALRSLPDHSTCMSVPDLEAIKALIKTQAISELREQEFLRLLWLKAKLSQMDYDPRYPDSSWYLQRSRACKRWVGATNRFSRQSRAGMHSNLACCQRSFRIRFTRGQIGKRAVPRPNDEGTPQKLPATVGAAADAAQAAVNPARHRRPAQPGALPPPVSP